MRGTRFCAMRRRSSTQVMTAIASALVVIVIPGEQDTPRIGAMRTERARELFEWLFEQALAPFERFLRRTTAGGIVLVATTALTLALTSAIGEAALDAFWERPVALLLGESA